MGKFLWDFRRIFQLYFRKVAKYLISVPHLETLRSYLEYSKVSILIKISKYLFETAFSRFSQALLIIHPYFFEFADKKKLFSSFSLIFRKNTFISLSREPETRKGPELFFESSPAAFCTFSSALSGAHSIHSTTLSCSRRSLLHS